MMISKLSGMMVVLLYSGFCLGAVRTVEVTASGLTKELAIEAGLIRAVSQVKGAEINSNALRVANQVKINGQTNTQIAISNVTQMKTRGQIESYEVLDATCDEVCEVQLSVAVPVYKTKGLSPDSRRKLVVAPFDGRYGEVFSENLQSALVQSRRFAVLDRQHNAEYAQEKALLLSPDTALKEKVKLGQVLGLDYLIVGEVSYSDNSFQSTSSYTGESSYVHDVKTQVNYKVINLATRQIKWQDSATIEMEATDPLTALSVSRDITSAIYPMKVVSSQNGYVILNQGGATVSVGENYDLFKLGEKLIDPYTKESLGREEIFVDQVKVTKVTSKTSYATTTTGDVSHIPVGTVARLADDLEDYSGYEVDVPVESTVKPSSSGGILLPFGQKEKPSVSPEGGVVIKD